MKHHLVFILSIGLLAGCKGGAESERPADQIATTDVQTDLAGCGACHTPEKNDLSGLSQVELLGKLQAIKAGKTEHPSKLDQYDDTQLQAMAASLAKK